MRNTLPGYFCPVNGKHPYIVEADDCPGKILGVEICDRDGNVLNSRTFASPKMMRGDFRYIKNSVSAMLKATPSPLEKIPIHVTMEVAAASGAVAAASIANMLEYIPKTCCSPEFDVDRVSCSASLFAVVRIDTQEHALDSVSIVKVFADEVAARRWLSDQLEPLLDELSEDDESPEEEKERLREYVISDDEHLIVPYSSCDSVELKIIEIPETMPDDSGILIA